MKAAPYSLINGFLYKMGLEDILRRCVLKHVSMGSTFSHLVTYFTAVIIYLALDLFAGIGNGPMKSMAQISNVRLGFTNIKGISVQGRGRPSR